MTEDRSGIVPFLKKTELFARLTDEEIARAASKFTLLSLNPSERLFSGRDAEENFYIIRKGRIFLETRLDQVDKEKRALVEGDHFIEEDLLYNQPANAYITTDQPTELLRLESDEYYRLLRDFPQIKPSLARTPESQHLVRNLRFDWLNPEEFIIILARKHEALLLLNLIGPVVLFFIALAVIFNVTSPDISETFLLVGAIFSSLSGLAGLAWGVWNWIDWGNDYYIVTNQRVVWVEKVIWLYESLDEAPLGTVLSVNVTTSLVGRFLNYGNVRLRTYTGEILFWTLRDPYRISDVVEEYKQRKQKQSERVEKQKIEQALRQRLGWSEEEAQSEEPIPTIAPVEMKKPGFWQKYFSNFLKMRFDDGNVITYRKYWTILLGKVWLPSLLILLLLGGLSVYFAAYLSGSFQSSPGIILAIGFLLFFFILFPWWLYHYIDWRNDIYQVTDKYILDVERKPLGTEVKKSASLENILSLEHERLGLIGFIFNFGNVIINVGETQFDFMGVHNPARAQQDIFNRMDALRRQKELAQAARERERIVEVVTIYHRNAEEARQEEEYFDMDEEYWID